MTPAEVADLYSQHGYALFRRCVTFLGDEAAAQDAVQEVFVRAIRAADGFRGDASPKTWLSRIADHHCLDVLRRAKRSPLVPAVTTDAGADGEPARELPDLVRGDEHDTILGVRRMLVGLDPPSQRLAVLYFIDELTQEEIAQELGLSRRTIGKRVRALGDRMRSLLSHEESA